MYFCTNQCFWSPRDRENIVTSINKVNKQNYGNMKQRMLGLLAAAGIMSMANTDAMAITRSVDWSNYAGEARDVFVERGGNAETALYAEYDLDNDGRKELIIYDTQYANESDRHVCVFSIDDKYEEMQFVVDAPSPAFCYNFDGKGT